MRERDIFIEALQHSDPAQRSACLNAACAGDDDLRQRVLQLLAEHEKQHSFLLDAPPHLFANHERATTNQPANEAPGTLIGPYKLLEQIGEGGMGTVWMAQQTEPVKRIVAIKLIKAGMDSKQVVARFEAERQALALMDHANIARVVDVGTTSAGRPYFVMDLVKGVPITRYCDEQQLTPRQRLEMFIPVCQAVQHAHQKGVIHRDLKPSNVLVAVYDGRPVPKVIDFGVAKATGQPLTEKTLVTGFGAIVGTLEYMSPEQAEINQLDIDTRSDIYSLGVLLYELLVGSPPFSKQELEKIGMLEMLRVIREQEPSKPSTKLSTAEGLPTLAANRGTEPAKLMKLVRGELDWIVMKALEKDRNRRYETANSFAMDLQRYLSDEPVEACPPSLGYRLRKFARRNRHVLAMSALLGLTLVALLIAGGVVVWKEKVWAEERYQAEKTQLEQVERNLRLSLQALDEVYLEIAEERWAYDVEFVDERFLRKALKFYEAFVRESGDNPLARVEAGRAYRRVASIRAALGEPARAEEALAAGIGILGNLVEEFPNRADLRIHLGGCHNTLGLVQFDSGRLAAAESSFRRALEIYRTGPDYSEVRALHEREIGSSLHNLANVAEARGQMMESVLLYEAAVGHQRTAIRLGDPSGWPDVYLVRGLAALGYSLGSLGRRTEAERHLQEAVQLSEKLARDSNSSRHYRALLGRAHFLLASEWANAGRNKEAEVAYRQCLEIFEKLAVQFPKEPDYQRGVTDGKYGLARVASGEDRLEVQLRALESIEKLAADRPHIMRYRTRLGLIHCRIGDAQRAANRLPESVDAYHKALHVQRELLKQFPDHAANSSSLAITLNNLAVAVSQQGDLREACRLLEEAIELHRPLAESSIEPKYRENLRKHYFNLTERRSRLGEHGPATEAAAGWCRLVDDQWPRQAEAIGQLLQLEARAEKDGKLTPSERKKAIAAYIDLATDLLERATRAGAGDAQKQRDLAKLYQMVGYIQQSKLVDPQHAVASFDRAIAHLTPLLYAKPVERKDREEMSIAYHSRASVLRQLRRGADAVDDHRKAVDLNEGLVRDFPDETNYASRLAVSYNDLGHELQLNGEVNEAADAYRKALKRMPSMPIANQRLAHILLTAADPKLRDHAAALPLAKKAVEGGPKLAFAWSTLALAHSRAGDWKAARSALDKAMDLRKGGTVADWFILAICLWKQGDKAQAGEWYDRGARWMQEHRSEDNELRRARAEAAEVLGRELPK